MLLTFHLLCRFHLICSTHLGQLLLLKGKTGKWIHVVLGFMLEAVIQLDSTHIFHCQSNGHFQVTSEKRRGVCAPREEGGGWCTKEELTQQKTPSCAIIWHEPSVALFRKCYQFWYVTIRYYLLVNSIQSWHCNLGGGWEMHRKKVTTVLHGNQHWSEVDQRRFMVGCCKWTRERDSRK